MPRSKWARLVPQRPAGPGPPRPFGSAPGPGRAEGTALCSPASSQGLRLLRPGGPFSGSVDSGGPRVPGASASLGQLFLPVAFSVSASSPPVHSLPEPCLLNFSEVFLLSRGVQTLRLDREFSRGQGIVFVELQKCTNLRTSALGDKFVEGKKKKKRGSPSSL